MSQNRHYHVTVTLSVINPSLWAMEADIAIYPQMRICQNVPQGTRAREFGEYRPQCPSLWSFHTHPGRKNQTEQNKQNPS